MGTRELGGMEATLMDLEKIADLAYQRWESEGRPGGRNLDFWAWAEAEVLARPSQAGINLPPLSPTLPPPAA